MSNMETVYHAKSTEMVSAIGIGYTFPGTNSQVVAAGPVKPGGEGLFAGRIVIRTLPDNEFHPLVVHLAYYDDEFDKWCFASGDYCRNISDAVSAFNQRTRQR